MSLSLPKNLWVRGGCLILVALVISAGWNFDPERRWGWFPNSHAHCAGCSTFLVFNLRDYVNEHDGWFPKGGATPFASLGQSLKEPAASQMSNYAGHPLAGAMWEHYSRHGVLSEEFSAYRYNEGLREEDPADLVLMYRRAPTKWVNRNYKGTKWGRNVLKPDLGHFEFYTEAEFQAMQARTEAFLRDRKLRASDYAWAASNLVLTVNRATLGENTFRFTVSLKNSWTNTVSLKLTRDGALKHREGGWNSGSDFLAKEGMGITLAANEERLLPGWSEVSVNLVTKDGQPIKQDIVRRHASGIATQGEESEGEGKSSTIFGPGAKLEEAQNDMTVQAVLWVHVNTGELKPLDTVLKSPALKYMRAAP